MASERFPLPLIPVHEGQCSFTAVSVFQRLPAILASLMESHCASQEPEPDTGAAAGTSSLEPEIVVQLERLSQDIREDAVLTVPGQGTAVEEEVRDALGPQAWQQYLETYGRRTEFEEDQQLRWSTTPWFVSESYLYFRIMVLAKTSRNDAFSRDPFHIHKQKSLDNARKAFNEMLEAKNSWGTRTFLLRSLWGNKADLSLSGGVNVTQASKNSSKLEDNLLTKDLPAAVAYIESLERRHDASVAFMLDNCGLELLSDLLFAHALTGAGIRVTLHCKFWPTFVSDATADDINIHLDWIKQVSNQGKRLAEQIRREIVKSNIRTYAHSFYNTPCPMEDMPKDLMEKLAQDDLCILKGDANYRRLLGDRKYPYSYPFQHIVENFPSKGVLVLRTCKSDVLVGACDSAVYRAMELQGDSSRTSGDFGVVSFA